MEFNVNSPILYVLVGIIIVLVLGQSVYFLYRALKRAKEIGMDKKKLRKTMITSGIFTIAPAVSILIGVVTLSQSLGIPLPWLRLSVVGSLTYETVAASNALAPMGVEMGNGAALTAQQFVTIASVMTVSIMAGIWMVPVFGKKIQKGLVSLGNKDKKWGEIFVNSLFVGMISAFLGFVFCDVGTVVTGSLEGLIPVCVMAVSAIVMCICGLIKNKFKWNWINDYALPISLIAGMAAAIPITGWLS